LTAYRKKVLVKPPEGMMFSFFAELMVEFCLEKCLDCLRVRRLLLSVKGDELSFPPLTNCGD
jgi:hypothetical protein